MIDRFLRRTACLMLALVVALAVLPVAAASTPREAATTAAAWIQTQQQPDGSFAGFGVGSTADAVLALAAAGLNPAAMQSSEGKTPLDAFAASAQEIAADPGLAAKVVIALLRAGRSPQTTLSVDLVAAVSAGYAADRGHFGADVTSHTLSMLALVAAGQQVPEAAINWLTAAQLDDGSWSFTGDRTPGGGDTNSTALAVQALVAVSQKDSAAVQKAVAYLQSQQNADGGFPYSQTSQYGNASDANSTAYVIQAIIAVGQDPATWVKEGRTPLDRLMAFQNASGAFRYQDSMPEDNQLATYQAVPALVGQTFPLEPLAIIQQPGPEATPVPADATTVPVSPTVVPVSPTVVIQQPTPIAVDMTPFPLPETGVVEQPATLPNTGSADTGVLPLVAVALVLVLGGAALVLRRRTSIR